MCYAQETLADNIRTWMEEELRALISRTQMLDVMPLTEDAKSELGECKRSIARVYEREITDTFGRQRDRRAEIESGLYENPLESQLHLKDGLDAVLDLMRSLLGIRLQVDTCWKDCVPDSED